MKETYKIPEERMHYLKRKLAQINKRAVKLGLVEISMEVGAVSSEKYKDEFGYDIDALSGVISGSPLLISELRGYTDVPVINNMNPKSFKDLLEVVL